MSDPADPAESAAPAAAPSAAAAPATVKKPPAKKAATSAEAAADGLVEAEVLRGTVYTEAGPVGPGGTVRLPAADVARMRRDRLLVDPDNGPLAAYDGPQISQA